jgi:hypothetical protein
MELTLQQLAIISGISFGCWVICLFLAMKITRVGGSLGGIIIVCIGSYLAGAAASFFVNPLLGVVVGTIVLYVLIGKLTDADFIPDALLMVIVANVLYLLVIWWVLSKARSIYG